MPLTSTRKKLYFNEEFYLDDSELCQTFLQNQGIDEATAKLILLESFAMRLVFKGEKLLSKDTGDGGEWGNTEIQDDTEAKFRYRDIPIHSVHIIEYQEHGLHHLGGKAPSGFQFPTHPNLPVSCQYIGKISNQDPLFQWLPVAELHIVYPLFASVDALFVDYAKPLAPQIIDPKVFEHNFRCVTTQSYIEFEKRNWVLGKLRTAPRNREFIVSGQGRTGVPFWSQYSEWPRCPKSGRLMKFVAQIHTTDIKAVEKKGIGPENAEIQHYLDTLNFWCDGTLYIFMEPETKVVCMLIQSS